MYGVARDARRVRRYAVRGDREPNLRERMCRLRGSAGERGARAIRTARLLYIYKISAAPRARLRARDENL